MPIVTRDGRPLFYPPGNPTYSPAPQVKQNTTARCRRSRRADSPRAK